MVITKPIDGKNNVRTKINELGSRLQFMIFI